MERELSSKVAYFEILQLLVEQQEELSVQNSHLHEAEAAVAAIRETRGQAVAEYRKTLSDELTKAEQKVSGLTQDLIPLVGRVPDHDGTWIAAGYSGHGNVLGLLCGELVASAMLGEDDALLGLFAPARLLVSG